MVFHTLADSALEEGLPKDKTKESKITPIISSKIAADTIEVPTLESSFPNSFNVATVIETDVAERMIP